jgi:hypothetical protein
MKQVIVSINEKYILLNFSSIVCLVFINKSIISGMMMMYDKVVKSKMNPSNRMLIILLSIGYLAIYNSLEISVMTKYRKLNSRIVMS